MRGKWTRRAAVALLATSLVITGCGSDDDEGGATATTEAEAEGDTEEAEGSPSIELEMKDYAYNVSGPLISGGSIEASNTGKELHMVVAQKMKAGKTMEDVTEALAAEAESGAGEEGAEGEEASTSTTAASAEGEEAGEEGEGDGDDPFAEIFEEEGAVGFAMGPGEKATISGYELEAGSYGLLCYVPTEGEGTPHAAKGMVAELVVTDGDAPEAPTPDATITIGNKKASAPEDLTAGSKVLEFKAEGGPHEGVFAHLNDGKTFKDLDAYFTKEFEGEDPPAKGAAANAPGKFPVFLFDFEGSLFVELELKAGTYSFSCGLHEDEENEDSPRHFEQGELVEFTVK